MQKKLASGSSTNPDITAILNLHSEGLLATSSIKSLLAAASMANDAGLSVEAIIVADKIDKVTKECALQGLEYGMRILEFDFGDLSNSRNAGIQASTGRYIAFLDGDDLWSENWILEAYKQAEQNLNPTVLHPEACLFFGENVEPGWLIHKNDDAFDSDWTSLAIRNHWTALSFADRLIYEKVPYQPNKISLGFGYEDWTWNAEIISHGFRHGVVMGTVHFVRMRPASLVKHTQAAGALMSPTQLFRNRLMTDSE